MPWYAQVSREQWRAFWAVFLGWVVDAFDFNMLAFILIDIQKSFTVDRALAGALGSVTLIMRLSGAGVFGTLADKYGRKLPLMLSVLWFSLFAFLSGFSTSYAMLFGLRALFGFGMGGEWSAGMPLVLEHWPSRYRGIASGLLQGGWNWGYLFAAMVFQFIYPLFNRMPDIGWRVMFWTAIGPALLTLWIRSRVSERPVWLERRERIQAAAREGRSLAEPTISLVRIFQRDLIGTTIQTTAVLGSFMCLYHSSNFWYPTLLREAGRPTLPYLAAFNVGAIVGVAVWGRLSETALGAAWSGDNHQPVGTRVAPAISAYARCRVNGTGGADDGRVRPGHVGHGARVHHRTLPDLSARRGPRLLLPHRCCNRRPHALRDRHAPGSRGAARHGDERRYADLRTALGQLDLAGTGNARTRVRRR